MQDKTRDDMLRTAIKEFKTNPCWIRLDKTNLMSCDGLIEQLNKMDKKGKLFFMRYTKDEEGKLYLDLCSVEVDDSEKTLCFIKDEMKKYEKETK